MSFMILFCFFVGCSLQWQISLRKSPCCFCLESFLITTRIQLFIKSWSCRIQAFSFLSDWSNPCHRSQEAFWFPCRI